MLVAEFGCLHAVNLLLNEESIGISLLNQGDETAMSIAIRVGSGPIVKRLLSLQNIELSGWRQPISVCSRWLWIIDNIMLSNFSLRILEPTSMPKIAWAERHFITRLTPVTISPIGCFSIKTRLAFMALTPMELLRFHRLRRNTTVMTKMNSRLATFDFMCMCQSQIEWLQKLFSHVARKKCWRRRPYSGSHKSQKYRCEHFRQP